MNYEYYSTVHWKNWSLTFGSKTSSRVAASRSPEISDGLDLCSSGETIGLMNSNKGSSLSLFDYNDV